MSSSQQRIGGGKRGSRNDKKARRAMHSRMRKGARIALRDGITKQWLKTYGDLYRKLFHTRRASSLVPDPAIAPEDALQRLEAYLREE